MRDVELTVRPGDELWRELGATMRALRTNHDRSLRWVEDSSGWGRGTLSQVETGKARPSLGLVDWYEEHFGGDGVLVSVYAAAVLPPVNRTGRRVSPVRPTPGDAVGVVSSCLPAGALVGVGERHTLGWTLANTGTVAWRARSLQRIGAATGPRLITSHRADPIPDCEPGDEVEVTISITTPTTAGTVVAYWEIVDETGAVCFGAEPLTTVLVVR